MERKDSLRVKFCLSVSMEPQNGQAVVMDASGATGVSWRICLHRSRSFSAIWTRTPPIALEINQSIWIMYSSRMNATTPPEARRNRNRWASSGVLNLAMVIMVVIFVSLEQVFLGAANHADCGWFFCEGEV